MVGDGKGFDRYFTYRHRTFFRFAIRYLDWVMVFTIISIVAAIDWSGPVLFQIKIFEPENNGRTKSLQKECRGLLSECVLVTMSDAPSDCTFFSEGPASGGIGPC
jgi:hypothetical protein